MGREAKITIDQDKKRVKLVEGGNTFSGDASDIEVYVEQATTLAPGCPAWIVIGGRKYQI